MNLWFDGVYPEPFGFAQDKLYREAQMKEVSFILSGVEGCCSANVHFPTRPLEQKIMNIKINGKPYSFENNLTIEQILKELNILQDQGIAVALNETVISKNHFPRTYIKDGDCLEIIHAVAGG